MTTNELTVKNIVDVGVALFSDSAYISHCCSARVIDPSFQMTDGCICSKCGDHCEPIRLENEE